MCSLVSDHIYNGVLTPDTYEVVLRQVYKQITFQQSKDKILIHQFKNVGSLEVDRNAKTSPRESQPLTLSGVKFEPIQDVLQKPENLEHIQQIKRNQKPFNPND